ncbi:MAG: PilN domain-containing protein [Massilia sp.]
MKRVRIDFAPAGLRRTLFRTPRAAWGPAAAGMVLCTLAATAGWRYLQQQQAYQAQVAALEARANAPAAAPVVLREPAVPEAQASAVNAAILQLNLPWRALRDAVQAATPPAVALLALEPESRKRTLRITAETASSDEMIGYVERLQRQEWFTSVTLARHEINDQDPNHPIRFQVEAQWRAE